MNTNEHPQQSNEDRILNEIMEGKWRGKYSVSWCNLCDRACIQCPVCGNGSCSGGGCEACHADFGAFHALKCRVEAYLSDSEAATYRKALRIRWHILGCFRSGADTVDWDRLVEDGRLSLDEKAIFLPLVEEKPLLS